MVKSGCSGGSRGWCDGDVKQAESTGEVLIRRRDGRTLAWIPEEVLSSPPAVPSMEADVSTQETVTILRKGRERTGTRRAV